MDLCQYPPMAEQSSGGGSVVFGPARAGRAAQQRERVGQLQRIPAGSGIFSGVLRELPCRPADHHPHRRQSAGGRRRNGELHGQNLPCDLYGSGLVRRRDRRKQTGHIQQRRFPAGEADGGGGQQERVHKQQFECKFALVLVAGGCLCVQLLPRPQRPFLRRFELELCVPRRQGRSPAL